MGSVVDQTGAEGSDSNHRSVADGLGIGIGSLVWPTWTATPSPAARCDQLDSGKDRSSRSAITAIATAAMQTPSATLFPAETSCQCMSTPNKEAMPSVR